MALSRIRSAVVGRWRRARYLWQMEMQFLHLEWKQSRRDKLRWSYRIGCWWKGFHTFRAPLYRLDDPVDGPLYVRDREIYRNSHLNQPFNHLLDDKVAFWALIRTRTAHLAPVCGMLCGGRYYPLDGSVGETTGVDAPGTLFQVIPQWRGSFFLKPCLGSGGVGTLYLQCTGDGMLAGGSQATPAQLATLLGKRPFLLSPALQQAAYSSSVQPGASNTIRLLTVFDHAEGRAHVVSATQNFGYADSSRMDHWYRGGVACDIDPETGITGPGVLFPHNAIRRETTTHPQTGAQVQGIVIPHWTQIRAEIERLAATVGFLPYVGWDVLPTDDSFFIIEGNSRSALGLLQTQRPLLANPHFRRMLGQRNLLPRRLCKPTKPQD